MNKVKHKHPLSIGTKLRSLREDNDYSQKEIANILFCSQQTYSRYETEEIKIDVASLIILSNFYDVSIDYIVGLTNDKKRHFLED